MAFDTTTLFTAATELKDYTFTLINPVNKKAMEFKKGEVPELEISYNGFIVLTYAVMNDQIDALHYIDASKTLSFVPFILDLVQGYYRREFAIVKVDKSSNPHQKTATFYGQDIISYTLSKLFISKTYDNAKLSDVFKDIYDTYVVPKMLYPKKDIYTLTLESNLVMEKFVLTSQKSVLDFFTEECERQGLAFFQDKGRVVMIPYTKLKPNNLQKETGTYRNVAEKAGSDAPSLYDILAYKVSPGNQAFKPSKTQVTAFDPATKTNKILKVNLEDLGIEVAKDAQDNEGFNYASQEYVTEDNLFADTYKAFLNSSKVDIIIPGFVFKQMIFTRYDLVFRGGDSGREQIQAGDIKNSGTYILTNYVEKITQGQYYIIKATMARFKDRDRTSYEVD